MIATDHMYSLYYLITTDHLYSLYYMITTDMQVIIIAQQIAQGMGYLHHKGIIHKVATILNSS